MNYFLLYLDMILENYERFKVNCKSLGQGLKRVYLSKEITYSFKNLTK